MNINKVTLAGRITRDVELRFSTAGTAVCSMSVAINSSWKAKTGEKKEEVTFVDVTAFGKTAEAIGKYLKKGDPIYLEGRLKLDQWDDKKTGEKRTKLGVILEEFQFVGGKGKSEPDATARPAGATAQPQEEDSVPF